MSILNLFRRRSSAPLARERLQILLSHERTAGKQPDLLAILHEEILATIARQITVERENVRVRIDRGATVSTLEIDVEIPHLVVTVPTTREKQLRANHRRCSPYCKDGQFFPRSRLNARFLQGITVLPLRFHEDTRPVALSRS
jgi:cell division topological specificity factor